jgi:GntR family transcriptional regulator
MSHMALAHDDLLYSQIESVLASEITGGYLKIGDQLPTEDGLIERFEVSRITIRRAIQNLSSRGLVEIRRGKGTFVAAPPNYAGTHGVDWLAASEIREVK